MAGDLERASAEEAGRPYDPEGPRTLGRRDLLLRGVDGKYLKKSVQFCDVCQASWEGPAESRLAHEGGKKHRSRLLAAGAFSSVTTRGEADTSIAASGEAVPTRWSASTFDTDVAGLGRRLCDFGPLGVAGAATAMPRRGARRAVELQAKMRRGEQHPEDFDDSEALWGYAMAKLPLRARTAFDALTVHAPPSLTGLLAKGDVSACSFGGGPGAELLALAAARDLAGGAGGSMAVFDLVDGWRPIVDAVATLLGEPIEYHSCDVTLPLADARNAALRGANFDIAVFSYVLLEAQRSSEKAGAALTLLRDLWHECPRLSHVLVLDAGQARGGRSRREGRLAGSLGEVETLGEELGADLLRVEGERKTDGLFLSRRLVGGVMPHMATTQSVPQL